MASVDNEKRLEGAEIRYTVCAQNGCWDGCLLRCYVKDGKLLAVDNGDPLNAGDAHEDVGMEAAREGMLQHRPCVRGHLWRKSLYDPKRVLHPMKNIGKKGAPKWQQISWDEALDTVADNIKEITEKYGPLSIHSNGFIFGVGMYAGFGYGSWGCCSFAGHQVADHQVLGVEDTAFSKTWGTEPQLLLDSKCIIAFGWNPGVTRPEYAYMMTLAKEQGTPIIMIDSRYSPSVAAYATQWIPIKSGTDLAFMMAMAHVLFTEDLIDHAYVEKFVEADGLAKWRDHILGADGTEAKTPEWAEKICAVPAETIRELARLYGQYQGYSKKNPCYMICNWSLGRSQRGENVARVGVYLQALTGNIGVDGGFFNGGGGGIPPYFPQPMPAMTGVAAMPTYMPPFVIHFRGWVDAILLKDDLDAGNITEAEYRARIGSAADMPLPDIHMVFTQNGNDIGTHDTNKLNAALKKVDFVVSAVAFLDHPIAQYADIVLPMADKVFEDYNSFPDNYGFVAPTNLATGTFSNFMLMKRKVVDAPGEAKPMQWINAQIAKRLGCGETFAPRFLDVLDDDAAWDARYEQIQAEAYEMWRPQFAAWAEETGCEIKEAPTWEEFQKSPIFRVPYKKDPFYPLKPQIDEGVPFNTPSGKIEFYSQFLADPDMSEKAYTFPDGSPSFSCYGGAKEAVIEPIATYIEPPDHPNAEAAKEFPLRLITPHTFFRQHMMHDSNIWTKGEARHGLWINPVDAAARGIKDNDKVHIFNAVGEGIIPAYVTARIAPGTICIEYGGWYKPGAEKTELMPDGIDLRGSANVYTTNECYPWITGNLHCANLAQVEKVGE